MLKGTLDFFNLIYPVGSVYTTFDTLFNPNISFGGTWQKLNDTFLYATNTASQVGATGGSANAVVVSHRHDRINPLNNPEWVMGDTSGLGGTTAYTYIDVYSASLRTNQSHTLLATNYAGESGTGKNMPPYTKVIMWKRTA